jgi:hypothetical protein
LNAKKEIHTMTVTRLAKVLDQEQAWWADNESIGAYNKAYRRIYALTKDDEAATKVGNAVAKRVWDMFTEQFGTLQPVAESDI